ncbi:uncharacterized protein LOC132752747 [Ruditapes philippinarum]|uniref:uncharacterized protein LOC132752747 n=1 Tax=Ruditapes philippinarum TaxID=129788 RepID=UPI00295C35C9|nr:uncharacterized protein LOC132752747 [Ruditapes philippinarum]
MSSFHSLLKYIVLARGFSDNSMMDGIYLSVFITLVVVGSVVAPPASRISEIKITRCSCTSCSFKQIGYGYVYVSFNSARVSCTKSAILRGRTVIGWNHNCPISSSSGKFEVKAGNICGKDYDRVYLNNCKGYPCSGIGR